jgi:acyl-coenzyme A synthetase/AMP-(fatty) acid ligase
MKGSQVDNTSKSEQLIERTRANSIMAINSACGKAAAALDDVTQAMARSENSDDVQPLPELFASMRERVERLASTLRQPNGEKLVDQSIDFAARHPTAVASGAAFIAGLATYAFATSARKISDAEDRMHTSVSNTQVDES